MPACSNPNCPFCFPPPPTMPASPFYSPALDKPKAAGPIGVGNMVQAVPKIVGTKVYRLPEDYGRVAPDEATVSAVVGINWVVKDTNGRVLVWAPSACFMDIREAKLAMANRLTSRASTDMRRARDILDSVG